MSTSYTGTHVGCALLAAIDVRADATVVCIDDSDNFRVLFVCVMPVFQSSAAI